MKIQVKRGKKKQCPNPRLREKSKSALKREKKNLSQFKKRSFRKEDTDIKK